MHAEERFKARLLWGLQVILGGTLLFMGILPKLTRAPEMVANFQRWGYPDGARYLIAAAEIVGTTLFLIPRTVSLGGMVLTFIMLGALGTHLRFQEYGMAPLPIVLASVAIYVALQRRAMTPRRVMA